MSKRAMSSKITRDPDFKHGEAYLFDTPLEVHTGETIMISDGFARIVPLKESTMADRDGVPLDEIVDLDKQLEDCADKLSDCWLLLDAMTRCANRGSFGLAAERLLRKQKAPGWK